MNIVPSQTHHTQTIKLQPILCHNNIKLGKYVDCANKLALSFPLVRSFVNKVLNKNRLDIDRKTKLND